MHSIPNIPDALAREIYAELCRALPPPPDDTPEARHRRDEHAMTAVAHLLPENAAEADIAVLIVTAQARAREAFRAAAEPGLDPDRLRQCCAQAACMMRQADSAIRTLLRLQAERQKAEDALRPAAMQRAGIGSRSAIAISMAWGATTHLILNNVLYRDFEVFDGATDGPPRAQASSSKGFVAAQGQPIDDAAPRGGVPD